MKRIMPFCVLVALGFAVVPPAYAVRINLDGPSASVGTGGTNKNIGYVDIERVFESHPMKQRMHSEFLAEVEKCKKDQTDLQCVIDDNERVVISSSTVAERLRAEIAAMKESLAGPATSAAPVEVLLPGTTIYVLAQPKVIASTQPVVTQAMVAGKEAELFAVTAGVDEQKKELARRKSEMSKKARDNKDSLSKLEESKTASVLADIYQILEKMTVEENIDIVIDKNNVLYGQPTQDLTDKVIERLQGR